MSVAYLLSNKYNQHSRICCCHAEYLVTLGIRKEVDPRTESNYEDCQHCELDCVVRFLGQPEQPDCCDEEEYCYHEADDRGDSADAGFWYIVKLVVGFFFVLGD